METNKLFWFGLTIVFIATFAILYQFAFSYSSYSNLDECLYGYCTQSTSSYNYPYLFLVIASSINTYFMSGCYLDKENILEVKTTLGRITGCVCCFPFTLAISMLVTHLPFAALGL